MSGADVEAGRLLKGLKTLPQPSNARFGVFPQWPVATQLLCVGIMIVLNACVWRFFVKALHTGSGSSLVASLVSAATNYVTSAILGWLIFDEHTSLLWWLGTSLVLTGLLFIISGTEEDTTAKAAAKPNKKTE